VRRGRERVAGGGRGGQSLRAGKAKKKRRGEEIG